MGVTVWWAALIVAAWCEVSLVIGIVIASVGARRRARLADGYQQPPHSSATAR